MNKTLKMDKIKNSQTLHQAAGHKKILVSYGFNFWLSFFSKIMPLVDILFGQLQKREINSISAQRAICNFEQSIQVIREKIDVDLKMPTQSSSTPSKKRKTDNTAWKREAKEVCDVIIREAKDRFNFTGHLVASNLFSPDMFKQYTVKFPEEAVKKVCSIYSFFDKAKLSHELSSIYSAEEFQSLSGAVSLLDFIVDNNLEKSFNESTKLLKLVLTVPMTSVEAERCFSTLNRIKTFLRNSMCQERLTALAMLSIEKDLIMEIPDFNQRVIDKFAAMKERRMDFLFR